MVDRYGMQGVTFVALLMAAVLALPVNADEAKTDGAKLTGADIKTLLPTIASPHDNSRQTFETSGETRYENQRGPSSGSWRVEGDQYCSVWPPSRDWTCYDVAISDSDLAHRPT